ncbi:hypothetical protein [Pedobacter mendelii]|uniref:Uncharacterized protein n=1 Tax=Pedobacter mendelii TaxID=1908240 RepID=A0ABQ2BEP4_9SPHI|nr:hypothetical protein [Pedobacter mendelii]GGI24298.1 hypothetical protein GCM10008119_11960 [Pedobacter mendelii]
MENQENNTEKQKPHPKPSDDAQSQIETIIPSTESEESTTTKVENQEVKNTEPEQEPADKVEKEETKEKPQPKSENDKGDEIETVSP